MIQNIAWYSAFPLMTGALALVLGIAALRRDRHIAIANGFLVLMLVFLCAGIFDFLMINASDTETALLFARGLILSIVLIFAGFLFLSTSLALIPLNRWLGKNIVLYSAMSFLVGLVLAYNLNSLEHNQYGFGLPDTPATLTILVVLAAFTAYHAFPAGPALAAVR